MGNTKNKFISVIYKLYATADGKESLVEEATTERPFNFISGFGVALDAFEEQISGFAKDDPFNFELTKEQAYGDADPASILELPRETFNVNDKFDSEHVYMDAIIPLQNSNGQRFWGRVIGLDDTNVKLDMNHPLAGKTLRFEGKVIENREATNKEIETFAKMLSGEGGCNGNCEGCGEGGCNHDHEDGKECGCGNCQH